MQELIQFKGGGYNEEAVADIIENALKILADIKDTGDVRVIQTAVRELAAQDAVMTAQLRDDSFVRVLQGGIAVAQALRDPGDVLGAQCVIEL